MRVDDGWRNYRQKKELHCSCPLRNFEWRGSVASNSIAPLLVIKVCVISPNIPNIAAFDKREGLRV